MPYSPSISLSKPPVAFLLAVWGKSYIEQFLEISLRSLLAPGNIPAMAEKYDCTFIFLTAAPDRKTFEAHPVFHILKEHCKISFIDIRDLIFGGNYSATVTLAYERGMRKAGTPVCETYFIYLVSDYIMADGSLRGLMRYMAQGYSGITAGNFQIVEEICRPHIRTLADRRSDIIAIPPRELLAYAFHHLHPMTVANTVTQSLCHSQHSNRLFWQVDDHTLVGRFYLRHMLCIKPEIDNYTIGASCDYSFIPEMCPSGNVAHIDDSDEYCVVELQPLNHEKQFIRFGPLNERKLAQSLAEWTTVQHRANAHTPVVFHAQDKPDTLDAVLSASKRYIESIEKQLPTPIPFQAHPYWISCIEGVTDLLLERSNQSCYFREGVFAGIHGSPVFGPVFDSCQSDYLLLQALRKIPVVTFRRRIWQCLSRLAGTPPHVYLWHRCWRDYRSMIAHVDTALTDNSSALLASYTRTPLADWLYSREDINSIFQYTELLLHRPTDQLIELLEHTRTAIIVLKISQLPQLNVLVNRLLELFPNGCSLTLIVVNERDRMFKHHLAAALNSCNGPRFENIKLHFNTGPLRATLDAHFQRAMHLFFGGQKSWTKHAYGLGMLTVLGGLYATSNLIGLTDKKGRKFKATSAIVSVNIKPVFAHMPNTVKKLEACM